MKVQGDVESVNLNTGESVTGNGDSFLESFGLQPVDPEKLVEYEKEFEKILLKEIVL